LDLGEVTPGVLRKFERVMSSGQSSLQIPQQDVEPFERLNFRSSLAARSQHHLMRVAQSFEHFEIQRPVGHHATPCLSSMNLTPIEQTKIDCARKFFAEMNRRYALKYVRYDVVKRFGKLMELVK